MAHKDGGRLHWPRILGYSLALGAALPLATLAWRTAAPAPPAPPLLTLAATTAPSDAAALSRIDINDLETCYALTELGRSARQDRRELLYLRCDAGHPDQFVARDAAYGRTPYAQRVELRRAGYGAIALRHRHTGAPPPIPPPVAMPPHTSELRPAPEVWTQKVSAEDWTAVTQMAEALLRDGVTPVRYRPRHEDGSTLLLEFCWQGRYGVFLRADTNLADAGDMRVIEFADRLFLLGGGRSHLDH